MNSAQHWPTLNKALVLCTLPVTGWTSSLGKGLYLPCTSTWGGSCQLWRRVQLTEPEEGCIGQITGVWTLANTPLLPRLENIINVGNPAQFIKSSIHQGRISQTPVRFPQPHRIPFSSQKLMPLPVHTAKLFLPWVPSLVSTPPSATTLVIDEWLKNLMKIKRRHW